MGTARLRQMHAAEADALGASVLWFSPNELKFTFGDIVTSRVEDLVRKSMCPPHELPVAMWHGAPRPFARLIESTEGMLGPGVYLAPDLVKAARWAMWDKLWRPMSGYLLRVYVPQWTVRAPHVAEVPRPEWRCMCGCTACPEDVDHLGVWRHRGYASACALPTGSNTHRNEFCFPAEFVDVQSAHAVVTDGTWDPMARDEATLRRRLEHGVRWHAPVDWVV